MSFKIDLLLSLIVNAICVQAVDLGLGPQSRTHEESPNCALSDNEEFCTLSKIEDVVGLLQVQLQTRRSSGRFDKKDGLQAPGLHDATHALPHMPSATTHSQNIVTNDRAQAGSFVAEEGALAANLKSLDFDQAMRHSTGKTMVKREKLKKIWDFISSPTSVHLDGDIVECGVWMGGSSMNMAYAELYAKSMAELPLNRKLWLFDTFEGLPKPDERDGASAMTRWRSAQLNNNDTAVSFAAYEYGNPFIDSNGTTRWNYGPLQEVQRNMESVGYPKERIHLVKGKVEDTLVSGDHLPDKIAVLRLDTDFYASTKVELDVLFQRLVPGGLLQIDDYCYWQGSRQATDKWLLQHKDMLEDVISEGDECFTARKRTSILSEDKVNLMPLRANVGKRAQASEILPLTVHQSYRSLSRKVLGLSRAPAPDRVNDIISKYYHPDFALQAKQKLVNGTGTGNEASVFRSIDISLQLPQGLLHHNQNYYYYNNDQKNIVSPNGEKFRIYAAGIDDNSAFEESMAEAGCEVHAFDCTISHHAKAVAGKKFTFHETCLGVPASFENNGYTAHQNKTYEFKLLSQAMAELGHKSIDILKFDIEGFEWNLFETDLLKEEVLPKQLAFELHTENANPQYVPPQQVKGKDATAVNTLFLKLYDLGYRVVSKEVNPGDEHCAEFVLVNIN